MLRKEESLKGQKRFEQIFKKGRRLFGKKLALYWLKNFTLQNRYGIVVSLKISKKSTQRNKIKRWIRVILAQNREKIEPGFDLIVRVLKKIESFEEVQQELSFLLKRSRLIKK